MHINNNEVFFLDWTTDVTPEERHLYSSTSIQDQLLRSQMNHPMTFRLTSVDVSCSFCWLVVSITQRAAPASRDDTLTLLITHMSIFNLSFLQTCISSKCHKRKTMNQFFHVVHTTESAALSDCLMWLQKKPPYLIIQKDNPIFHKRENWSRCSIKISNGKYLQGFSFKGWKDVNKINTSRCSSLALTKDTVKRKAALSTLNLKC